MEETYKINDGKVIHETLDGETIIINLENGNYYSTNASGAMIWDAIVAQYPIEQVVLSLENRYDVDPTELRRCVNEVIQFLQTENLILLAMNSELKNFPASAQTKEPFLKPIIEKYEDMQEMLLADPIHDVEAMGWPKLK